MAAAVAGGVTSLVCPPDTDPVLDEPGLVEMLKFRAEKLHQARVFPLGALTRGLAGEVLTEMAELTESGCVGFSQAEVPLQQHAGAAARAAVRRAPSATPCGCGRRSCDLGRGVAASGPLATRLGLSGVPVAAETIALHTIFELMRATGARVHLCRISSAAGRGAGARRPRHEGLPLTCDVSINSLHLTDVDIGYFDSRMRLNPPLRQQRDRDALRDGAGRRHHRRAGVRPHAGGRGRQDPALRRERSPAPPASNCCWRWRSSGAQEERRRPDARAGGADQRAGARAGRGAGHAAGERRPAGGRRRRRRLHLRPARATGQVHAAGAAQPGQAHAVRRLRAARAACAARSSAASVAYERQGRADAALRALWRCCGRWRHALGGLAHHHAAVPALDAAAARARRSRPGRGACCASWASRCTCTASRPPHGPVLLVANHISWLDILVHARGAPLPLRLQVRRQALAADRHAGHRRRHALHRAREAARRHARGAPHGREPASRRHRRGVSGRHHRRRRGAAALPRQPVPGGDLRGRAGAAGGAALRWTARPGADQLRAALPRRRHAAWTRCGARWPAGRSWRTCASATPQVANGRDRRGWAQDLREAIEELRRAERWGSAAR